MNNQTKQVKKLILIGGGVRGMTYLEYVYDNPDEFQLVAVVEPNDDRRNYIKERHNLTDEMCFIDWPEIFEREKFADAVIVATQDRMHYAPVMAAIDKGYDMLLEKPVAPTPEECIEIEKAALEKGVKIVVCHVLRYTDFYRAIKKFIDDGRLGRIMNVIHAEGVDNVHHSHSYVRGPWRNTKESAPMILAKSCHDMDMLRWLLGKKCTKIQSFGEQSWFKHDNKPEGSPERCIEGCPHAKDCYYDTQKLYIDTDYYLMKCVATGMTAPTDDDVRDALKKNSFGKCVFSSDNDTVDHQTVNMEFEDGATAMFSMAAFNKGGRTTRLMGTKGELEANLETGEIKFFDFATREWSMIDKTENADTDQFAGGKGHGGGDAGIMIDFYKYLCDEKASVSLSSIDVSIDSHIMAFAAEKSRLDGGATVKIDDYKEGYEASTI